MPLAAHLRSVRLRPQLGHAARSQQLRGRRCQGGCHQGSESESKDGVLTAVQVVVVLILLASIVELVRRAALAPPA